MIYITVRRTKMANERLRAIKGVVLGRSLRDEGWREGEGKNS